MHLDSVHVEKEVNGNIVREEKNLFEMLLDFRKDIGLGETKPIKPINDGLYHYTSIPSLLAILRNDSFRLSNSIYCNDSSEGNLIPKYGDWFAQNCNGLKQYDDYILSLCQENDDLSQWRGYCPNGGATIGLCYSAISGQANPYNTRKCAVSILDKDFSSNGCHEELDDFAIPVFYIDSKHDANAIVEKVLELAKKENVVDNDRPLIQRGIIPYLKNGKFHHEQEYRIVIPNRDEYFIKCIDYRTKEDKQLVPYIDIKMGRVSDSKKTKRITDAEIDIMLDEACDTEYILIPQCRNQEDLFNKIEKKIDKTQKYKNSGIKIICEGHLPVNSITIGPTHNREKVKEQVERFCKSRYWLRGIPIAVSEIPYIPPNE